MKDAEAGREEEEEENTDEDEVAVEWKVGESRKIEGVEEKEEREEEEGEVEGEEENKWRDSGVLWFISADVEWEWWGDLYGEEDLGRNLPGEENGGNTVELHLDVGVDGDLLRCALDSEGEPVRCWWKPLLLVLVLPPSQALLWLLLVLLLLLLGMCMSLG